MGEESDPTTLPEDNASYKLQEYWDRRFAKEDEYEWLVTYADVKGLLAEYLPQPSAAAVEQAAQQQQQQQQDGGLRVLVVRAI
jgi:hypothetical protein